MSPNTKCSSSLQMASTSLAPSDFGFHVAWVERGGGAMPPSSSDVGPPELFRLLRGGAERLGLGADKRVEALTDLPRVLAELAK